VPRPTGAVEDTGLLFQSPQSFRAALLVIAPAVPFVATITTLLIYLAPLQAGMPLWLLWIKANPLVVGTGAAPLVWLMAAGFYSALFRATSTDQANVNAYTQLSQRLRELDVRLAAAKTRPDLTATELSACKRAEVTRDLLRAELATSGTRWVLATGYISLWALVHRAEEALLTAEPPQDVVAAALYDELRLQDSQISNSAQLLAKLRLAVTKLHPEAAMYLRHQPPTAALGAAATAPVSLETVIQAARAAVRDVRQAINEFRDSSWDALVRTRNHLMGTLAVTGLATYLLLAIAISVRSGDGPTNLQTDTLAAAATFYVVGAMVGLFNRLYSESGCDDSIEDYGLTVARISLTPVLSGLAALGGVVIIAMLPAALSGNILTPALPVVSQAPASGLPGAAAPQSSTSSPGATTSKPAPSLEDIYSLRGNPLAIILAAIFGLTPNLLIGALQSAGDKYRAGLQSTATTTGGHT